MPEVELSAGTIDYEDTGGTGPVIVFVHGLIMDGSLWRHVVADLRHDYRCVLPTLPFGAHRRPMHPDADLSMRGMAEILGEFIEALDLHEITLAISDWGGPLLLVGGARDERLARLVVCSCEAFENVPPKGAAKLLPYIARVPGGLDAALCPFRFDRLRRLPMTYGPLSKRPVPREVMDGWFGPIREQREIRRDLRKYVRSAAQGRRDLLATTEQLAAFDRPALIAWASEDRLMRTRAPTRRAAASVQPRGDRRLLHTDPRGPTNHTHRAHARIPHRRAADDLTRHRQRWLTTKLSEAFRSTED